jgi:putative PIN family toxin of toxin-antitoxin system
LILVVDSGIWISGFQFGGTPLAALRLAYKQHQIATCDAILLEILSALIRKFGWTAPRVQDALADYLHDATHVEIPGRLRGVCRDSSDDMVFECALLSGASVIVSGDTDLLAVKECHGIRVLTPRAFLDEFTEQPEG